MEDKHSHSNPAYGQPCSCANVWCLSSHWESSGTGWSEGHGTEFHILRTYETHKKNFFFLNVLFSLQMSGMFESWLYKLVSALQMREKEANVVVVDWLPLAHKLYTDAVNNTRVVGHSVARMLDWLQVTAFKNKTLNQNHLK